MKTMIYSLALAALMSLGSCNDDDPILTQKDWDGTATYFASTDEQFSTYYKPYVGYVGDPMPFYDPVEQNFKILYLQEFRPNQEATYHPIWGVSTKNVDSYQSLGEVIPTGSASEADAAIGTGSTIYNESEKLYYTFYTGHTSNLEVVMMATSSDFKNWTKSKTFYLQGNDYGYSAKDFRDPFVFKGDDGVYHMIVSTQQGTKGVLAEFVSSDLKSWEHKGVFMSMMWDRFYECPDVFKMGDWWYLVYSEKHVAIRKVQYFKGHTLEELKACTANDAGIWPDDHEGLLDSRAFYAGKTASDGDLPERRDPLRECITAGCFLWSSRKNEWKIQRVSHQCRGQDESGNRRKTFTDMQGMCGKRPEKKLPYPWGKGRFFFFRRISGLYGSGNADATAFPV